MPSNGWISPLLMLFVLWVGAVLCQPADLWGQADPPIEQQQDEKQDGEKQDDEKQDDEKQDDEKQDDDQDDEKKQDVEAGAKLLDEAFELKLEARSTQDLEKVARLCGSALKTGLTAKDTREAKRLASASLFQIANQYGSRIFESGGRDRRWQFYRTQAIPKLKQALDYDPKLIEGHLLLAKLEALKGGDRNRALAAAEKTIELAVDDREILSEALFVRATLAKDADGRMADLNQAIKINGDNIQARQLRATLLAAQGKPVEALEDFKVWLKSMPKNYEARIVVADSLVGAGDKFDETLQAEALRLLDEAAEIKPDFTVIYTVRARVYVVAEQPAKAVEACDEAIKLEPKNIQALRLRATSLADLAKYDLALKDAESVIRLQGFSLDGIQLRAAIRVQQGEFGKAIEDFQVLAKSNPGSRPLQQQLAALYDANDEPAKGVKIYDRLIKDIADEDWEDRPAPQQLALLSERASLMRGRGDARLSLGEHAQAIGDYDEALKAFAQIQEIESANGLPVSKDDDGVLNNLAWVLATSPKDEVRDGERSIELATRAAEVTEYQEAHILSTLASGYAETGDFESAVKWVEKALEINRAESRKAADKSFTDKQFKSLNEELDSYRNEKAWRELQDPEEERAKKKKAKLEQEGEMARGKSDEGSDQDDKSEQEDGGERFHP